MASRRARRAKHAKRSKQAKRARQQGTKPEYNNESTAQTYNYRSLPTATSIRVLELLPSSEGIECTLHTVDLLDKPVFDALSYSWANPVTIRERPIPPDVEERKDLFSGTTFPTKRHPQVTTIDQAMVSFIFAHEFLPYLDKEGGSERCKHIKCDGKDLKVTGTLFDALSQLQNLIKSKAEAEKQGAIYVELLPVQRSQYLWIDQICIDQKNLDERAAQVALMSKIFSSAQYVFAWIGDFDSLGEAGLQAVLSRAGSSQVDIPVNGLSFNFKDLADMGEERKNLYVLTALLSRQWFRRAWVIQEAVFARRMFLWSGPFFVDWWILFAALKTLDERDMSKMSSLMGALIRRERMTRLVKKLVSIHSEVPQTKEPECITNGQIYNNIKGAISFMLGVAQVKEHLGLGIVKPVIPERRRTTRSVIDDPFNSLSVGFQFKAPPENNIWLPSDMEEPYDRNPSKQSQQWDKLPSQPFMDLVAPVTEGKVTDRDRDKIETKEVLKARLHRFFYFHGLGAPEHHIPKPVSLFSLITRFRDVGASDPRDKVFAFLYLSTETLGLKPNYRASVQEVFKGAAKLLLDQHDLTVLSYVQDPDDTKIPHLPSWVPDFSVPLGRTPFVSHDGSSPYSASGNSGNMNFYLTVGTEGPRRQYDIMVAMGRYLDTVSGLARTKGCYFCRVGELALQTPKQYSKKSDFWAYKSRVILRPQDAPWMPRVEALWRTMIGDCFQGTYPAPATAGFGFSDWVSTHLHESMHMSDLMKEHYEAVGAETASPRKKAFDAVQKRKQDIYLKLHAEEYGGYRCYDCTVELCEEKYQAVEEMYRKELEDMSYVPAVAPVRYLQDADRIRALFRCSHNWMNSGCPNPVYRCPNLTDIEYERMAAFEDRMREVRNGRRMFRTKKDLLGMGPKSIREGDEVWILLGTKVPFVLRPIKDGMKAKRFTVVGEAYVHGYMDGEINEEKVDIEGVGLV